MDTPIKKQSTVSWTYFSQHLPDFQTKYRGWFVNDELLVAAWQDHDSKDYVWDRIYETLLRVGGNLVVPWTDKERRYHRNVSRDMGLIIAHHHA
ncbi:glycosyl hydrolase 115 family protein, partial [Enterococcus faecium]|uniref:glycosyl hydrolase 115 family protein n=1 Tax=Enterococcus faecium TaxID=1352 RepID=UPI0034E9586F